MEALLDYRKQVLSPRRFDLGSGKGPKESDFFFFNVGV